MALGGGAVYYERGTPVVRSTTIMLMPGWPVAGREWTASSPCARAGLSQLLITEFIKQVSPLLFNPCHFQDYGRSMLYHTMSSQDRFAEANSRTNPSTLSLS